jgi:hypothetical protein
MEALKVDCGYAAELETGNWPDRIRNRLVEIPTSQLSPERE